MKCSDCKNKLFSIVKKELGKYIEYFYCDKKSCNDVIKKKDHVPRTGNPDKLKDKLNKESDELSKKIKSNFSGKIKTDFDEIEKLKINKLYIFYMFQKK